MIDIGFDLVLGKRTGDAADLAAAAETAPAADRVDIDPETAGGVQEGGAARKKPPPA